MGRIRVLHFISDSQATEYFRVIARHSDHGRFALAVGSLMSQGALQAGLREIGVPTFGLGVERRSEYPQAVVRLARLLRRNRVDVLHAHLFEASFVGLLAAQVAGTPVRVFTGHHSHEVPLHNRRALLEVDRFMARRLANVIVAPSGEMGDTFLNVYGCDPRTVEVIEHGLDFARFDPATANPQAFRTELGLHGKLVLGAISKHFWVKNLESLVHAFATLAAGRNDVHLIVLGIGDSSELAGLVHRLGLEERVSVLAPRDDVPNVLAACDLFIHPALAESFGFAVVEAMAMRLPVVATPVGIAREVIEDGVSGFTISGTDPDSIYMAITAALASRDRWPDLGMEARRRALRFTPERWVSDHERLYEKWIQRRELPSPVCHGESYATS
jgi:glycosyltransferase involved in cell wall biosynthesis